jgi:SAM-dependent methyltransferase
MKATERFGDRAEDYAAGRPSYPGRALDVLFAGIGDSAAVVAVDLGAGTGISSRLLAARGAQVIAVEPNASMRATAQPCPGMRWIDAPAEATTLPNASADLVTSFQAFHWFAPDAALGEILRILRPGGRAAVVYNERNEDDPFTHAYGEIVRRFSTDDTEPRRDRGRETFAAFPRWFDVRIVDVPNEHRLDHRGLRARARSTSYLPHEGPALERLDAELDRIFERFNTSDTVTMRMRTSVTLAEADTTGTTRRA